MAELFDAESFLEDLNKRFEEEEFISDFKVFLDYVLTQKVKLTPKNLWIPAKHIYAINSRFRNPVQLDHKLGDKIFKLREEPSYSRFYFMDLLAGASGCIEVDRKNVLVKGEAYDRFMGMGGIDKKRWLMLSWWFSMDWENWLPVGGFGELMEKKKLLLAGHLQDWLDKRGKVDFPQACRKLREDLNLTWLASSPEDVQESVNWGIQRCLLLPLVYFDVIEVVSKKGKYGIEKITGFYIKPLGRFFLEEIIAAIKKLQARYN